MENSQFPKSYLDFFFELEKRNVRYMFVGLAAAALQGAIIATNDIDLWVASLPNPGLEEAARAVGAVHIAPWDLRPPTISGPGLSALDLVPTMHGLNTFDEEYRFVRWIVVEGLRLPVLSVERIVESKKAANRPKDKAVLPILEELARTIPSYQPPEQKR